MKPTIRDSILALLSDYRDMKDINQKLVHEYVSQGNYKDALEADIRVRLYTGLIADLQDILNY